MSRLIENYVPVVKYDGFNTNKNLRLGGTVTGLRPTVVSGSGATATLTAAQSGSTVLFDRAAGIVFTLPASAVGLYFDFITTVTITTNNATVTVPTSSFLFGTVDLVINTSATTLAALGNGTSHVSIISNGSTTGGVQGSAYRITCISSTVWAITGIVCGSGSLATPFA